MKTQRKAHISVFLKCEEGPVKAEGLEAEGRCVDFIMIVPSFRAKQQRDMPPKTEVLMRSPLSWSIGYDLFPNPSDPDRNKKTPQLFFFLQLLLRV